MKDLPRSEPLVSVVMSVYNGADLLDETLNSVLMQKGCDFELVVVDDGSTDATSQILARHAQLDGRLRVFRQDNAGLTRALIFGCSKARGRFIARQDADDLSLLGRLHAQSDYLLSHPEVVVVAGTVRFVAPQGEWLFDNAPDRRIAIELDVNRLRAPSLVGTMFRRDAYIRCGGFHAQFVVAQDIDLWLRMEEMGPCHGVPAVQYQARMTLGGISSRHREDQYQLGSLAIECAKRRRRGDDEGPLLESFVLAPRQRNPMTRRERARFSYFIGSRLRDHDRAGARRYYRLALQDNPFHLKALLRWLIG